MIILKNQGQFLITNPQEDKLIYELAQIDINGRESTQSVSDPTNIEKVKKFAKARMKERHLNVFEFADMTIRFTKVSRGFTHELVRHRNPSYNQESTRYVDFDKITGNRKEMAFVHPPHKDENEVITLRDGRQITPAQMVQEFGNFYQGLRDAGWRPEDARQFLPIGIATSIVVKTNFRIWRYIFSQRTTKEVHWEIRGIMCDLVDHLKTLIPVAFDNFVEAGVDKRGHRYFKKINVDDYA